MPFDKKKPKPPITDEEKTAERKRLISEGIIKASAQFGGKKKGGVIPTAIAVPDITPKRQRRDPQDDIG